MSSKGFTLIELLVVIAIIGIVAGLSIPAVQSARESSRRTYCSNQIRQLAKGMIQYESQHRHFPSGGWGKEGESAGLGDGYFWCRELCGEYLVKGLCTACSSQR